MVYGVSELLFVGVVVVLFFGGSVVVGLFGGVFVVVILIGVFGVKVCDCNFVVGVLMLFGLGFGIFFLLLYDGCSVNWFSFLMG